MMVKYGGIQVTVVLLYKETVRGSMILILFECSFYSSYSPTLSLL